VFNPYDVAIDPADCVYVIEALESYGKPLGLYSVWPVFIIALHYLTTFPSGLPAGYFELPPDTYHEWWYNTCLCALVNNGDETIDAYYTSFVSSPHPSCVHL
jgi:hypothetical protein